MTITIHDLETLVDGNRDIQFVAFIDNVFVGRACIGMGEHASQSPWLYQVFVSESHRRRGVGSALVKAAIDKAMKISGGVIGLVVAGNNQPVISFYQKFGFAVVYIYDDGRILMSRAYVGGK